MRNEHIVEVAEEHASHGGGRNAYSFQCGAEWALEEVDKLLNSINLNEFIIGKVSFPVNGARHCQLEFVKYFVGLLRVAIGYGVDIRFLSPVEREELIKKDLLL